MIAALTKLNQLYYPAMTFDSACLLCLLIQMQILGFSGTRVQLNIKVREFERERERETLHAVFLKTIGYLVQKI